MNNVYIWGWYSDYDLSSFDELVKESCTINNISISKFGRLLLRIPYIRGYYMDLIKKKFNNLSDNDNTLFLSDDILYYDDLLKSLVESNCKIIILIRNKINANHKVNLILARQATDKIYTFDEGDADKYNIEFIEQYLPVTYSNIKNENKNSKDKIAYFIGLDKGRKDSLEELSINLKKEGVICNFTLVRKSLVRRFFGKSDGISYQENIENVFESDFLVEINSKGQDGLTLRALESVFYKKKLITNNRNICNFDFYNPQNIYVLNDDFKVPKSFILSEYDESAHLDLDRHLASKVYLRLMA
ncbi:hypothetical protein [Vibrio sinaloensis]|uniref:hypothetical protein n=1 Tax=Photobacterium sp. (strain ATCC 43367) TaxID=379097 RepID=UPI00057D8197|nr:hypothetical protein [Vibrio sinaloensis]KHT43143.1 hypothetical protein RJ47_12605 [Vibrio sinaloensis]